MRLRAPYLPEDLEHLDSHLLDQAYAVREMGWIAAGVTSKHVIGMRHDVDNVIEPAVKFAEWEAARGYKATYFILHTAPYWQDKPLLRRSLDRIAEFGHEIGIHNNAIAESLRTGLDPRGILAKAVTELRDYGYTVNGTVAHGDPLCRDANGEVRYVNDEMFAEVERPTVGRRGRLIGRYTTANVSLREFDLTYDANWLGRAAYLSDSGGIWSTDFDDVAAAFPFDGQLHVLIHPDWWPQAFAAQEIAS